MRETLARFLGQEVPMEKRQATRSSILGGPTSASLAAQAVKNLPAMPEIWVRSLGWKDPLEEGMAAYSNILSWTVPMDRGARWATVHWVTKSQTWLSD